MWWWRQFNLQLNQNVFKNIKHGCLCKPSNQTGKSNSKPKIPELQWTHLINVLNRPRLSPVFIIVSGRSQRTISTSYFSYECIVFSLKMFGWNHITPWPKLLGSHSWTGTFYLLRTYTGVHIFYIFTPYIIQAIACGAFSDLWLTCNKWQTCAIQNSSQEGLGDFCNNITFPTL